MNKVGNIFLDPSVATAYDNYYLTDAGKRIDEIEKQLISSHLSSISRGSLLELGCGTGHWSEFTPHEYVFSCQVVPAYFPYSPGHV
jgi:hypothetical protein